MSEYSEKCIDPNAGFTLQDDGSMKPNKLGYWVLTKEESMKIMELRRLKKCQK